MEAREEYQRMTGHRESFVIHAEYIEDIPEEAKAQFLMYVYNYGIHGTVPKLTGFEKTAWIKIQRRIDIDLEQYEATIKARSEAGKKHTGNQYTRAKQNQEEPQSSDSPEVEQSGTEWNKMEQNGTNGTVFVFDNEFVNEHENENESVAENSPRRESPPLQAYAQKIFNIFHEAGLPCARNNFISFLQRDFKNALGYIHKHYGPIHSDEVIGAAENYARTVNDPASFITGKYSFDRFVTFKNFVDFLPANYNADNFKDRKAEATQQPPKRVWKDTCPTCGTRLLSWSNQEQKYTCDHCGRKFEYEEVNK